MARVRGEEYEEYGGRGGKRRRSAFMDDAAKRRRVSALIDDEAIVDSDDEEEEEEGGEDGFIVDDLDLSDEEGPSTKIRLSPKPRSSAFFKEVDDLDDTGLEYFFNKRYGTANTDHDLEEIADVEQQSMLPSVRDSKLFLVKCSAGKERELAVLFLRDHVGNGSKSGILSVIAPDHLRSHIYIEAQCEARVKEAIKGKRSIFGGKVTMVPISEMSGVLGAVCKTADIATNDWARVKSGIFKGDIAKVVEVDNAKQRVTVKIIPRVDLEELANKLTGKVSKKRLILPPPRLMDIEKARELNIPVKHKRDRRTGGYLVDICGMMFKDGFLIKNMSMKSVSTQGAEPSFIEVERFRQAGDDATTKRRRGNFMKGDTVIAVKGDVKNLKGQVEKVEDGYVHIRPKSKGLPKTVVVEERHVCKYFEVGDGVKVSMGVHEGVTGVVVKVEGDVLMVLSDTTYEEVRVFVDHVMKSSEVGGRGGRSSSDEKHGVKPKLHEYYKQGGDNSWIGKAVRIRGVGAYYKGQRGVVKGVKGDDFRIQLDTSFNAATVWVNRKDVSESVEIFHPQTRPCFIRWRCGNHTPLRTPMRGGSAAAAAEYDESWGGMRTPLHCPAWIP